MSVAPRAASIASTIRSECFQFIFSRADPGMQVIRWDIPVAKSIRYVWVVQRIEH